MPMQLINHYTQNACHCKAGVADYGHLPISACMCVRACMCVQYKITLEARDYRTIISVINTPSLTCYTSFNVWHALYTFYNLHTYTCMCGCICK